MSPSCPICFDIFDGHDIIATPCGHVFHSKCILKWLDTSKVCPECRNKINKNNIKRLFFNTIHNETLPNASLQNDIVSKNAELKAKVAELASAEKKVKDLQEHAANMKELYRTAYQMYRSTQLELDSSKLQLKEMEKLESKVNNLIEENLSLKSQVNQFNQIHTVVHGTQQEAEEILVQQGIALAEEVGCDIEKNMAYLNSILKRKLLKVRAQKEEYKKKEDELLYQLGLKNDKIKKLLHSQADLQRQLKFVMNSPRPLVHTISRISDGAGVSYCTEGEQQITPLADGRKDSINPIRLYSPKLTAPRFKRKLDLDEDSITHVGYNGFGGHKCVGYNGLGGHERVRFAKAREILKKKS